MLAVSGALLVLDATVTLAWREPLSSLLAAREQAELAEQLDALPGPSSTYAESVEPTAVLARRHGRSTDRGDPLGRIVLPTLGRSEVMVEGTDVGSLRKGPGHYSQTALPGAGRSAVAGHRTTYGAPFRSIDRLRPGDPIVAEMPYGRLVYRVERTRIVVPSEVSVIREGPRDGLVLSACHPLYSAEKRIVVFARPERATASTRPRNGPIV